MLFMLSQLGLALLGIGLLFLGGSFITAGVFITLLAHWASATPVIGLVCVIGGVIALGFGIRCLQLAGARLHERRSQSAG